MNIRWLAVITGFVADTLISNILVAVAHPDAHFSSAPNLSQPADLLLITLLILSTGVGGYIAGRMAHADRTLNGLLVGVVDALLLQLDIATSDQPISRVFVVATAIGWGAAAAGGFLSRYPPRRRSGSSGQS